LGDFLDFSFLSISNDDPYLAGQSVNPLLSNPFHHPLTTMLSSFSLRFARFTPDLLIIGGGPAGYVAAIRASQLGLDTVCIEKESLLGGTCLREGCIPSKFLLNTAHKYSDAQNRFPSIGLNFQGNLTVNVPQIQRKKTQILTTNSKGIEFLFKKYGTQLERGTAFVNDPKTVIVTRSDGEKVTYNPKRLLLATGSVAATLPGVEIDEDVICTNRGVLNFKSVPKSLAVVGAGVVGLELGSVWNALGADVTIADLGDRIGGGIDEEMAKTLENAMGSQGIGFRLGVKGGVVVRRVGDEGEVRMGNDVMRTEKVLISIGRKPNLMGWGFEKLGIVQTKSGAIEVDGNFETNRKGVFAIGDIVSGPMLAHKAEEDGIECVERIVGERKGLKRRVIPSVIYTQPEIGSVGLNPEKAKEQGIPIKIGQFPFSANSRARCTGNTIGFVRWVCSVTGEVLGMQIVGENAAEAIAQGTVAVQNGLNIRQISETIHAHPTFSEALMEAAKSVLDKPIHI
jgi:dihydrolipoamide dehydrogenase